MGQLRWLEGYSGQTVEELIALEGTYRTDSIVLAFEQALQQKVVRVGQANLTEEERVILAIEAIEREVNNGGYHQFFINSSKKYAAIVVDALNRIGCAETAILTQKAIDLLGIVGPITVEAVDREIYVDDEERNERLNECDLRYYQTAGDLAEPLLEFIKNNKGKIDIKEKSTIEIKSYLKRIMLRIVRERPRF